MARSIPPFIVFTIGLAVGAGGLWFALQGREKALDRRMLDAEAAAERAARETTDWKASAAMEVQRNRTLEEELAELKALMRSAPAQPGAAGPAPGHGGAHGGASGPAAGGDDPAPPTPPVDPGTWDETTYRRHIDILSANPAAARQSKRYEAVLEAARLRDAKGRAFLASLLAPDLGMPASIRTVAVMLLEDLREPDVVPQVLSAYEKLAPEDDELLRNTLLNALAVLPGDGAVPHFLTALRTEDPNRFQQRAALRGLGRRGHEVALQVARGELEGIGKALRYVAIGNLNVGERDAGYTSVEVRTAFEQALPKLDGDKQAQVVLEALKHYWSPTSVDALQSFGDGVVGTPRTRAQARQLADAIASGAPRPDMGDDPVIGEPLDDSDE